MEYVVGRVRDKDQFNDPLFSDECTGQMDSQGILFGGGRSQKRN